MERFLIFGSVPVPNSSKGARIQDFEGLNSIFHCLGIAIMWFSWYGFINGGTMRIGEAIPSGTVRYYLARLQSCLATLRDSIAYMPDNRAAVMCKCSSTSSR